MAEAPAPAQGASWGGKYNGLMTLRLQQSSALSAPTTGLSDARRQVAAHADQLSEWKISCPNGGVVHAEQVSGGYGARKNIYFPGPVSVESPSGFLTVSGKPFRETIVIHPISSRKGWECEVVNHVDIESYLDGLVNMEFNASWPQEAIDAQVIAARTYALYQMMVMSTKKGGSHFDLDSDIKDQVYDGSTREDYRSKRSANRTRGMILKASLGDHWPIKAYYHSTCGGVTELPEVVWGKPEKGFKRRVACGYCKNSPRFVWDVPLTSREIAEAFQKGGKWGRDLVTSRLLDLRVAEQDPSGRALRVVSKWKSLEGREFALEVPANTFRNWIGPSRLKSTNFQSLAAGPDGWVLRGKGFGHGVGLCQWGAKTLGEMGKTSSQILKFYYPDTVLARAW